MKIKYPDVFGINLDDRLETTLITVPFLKVEQYFRNAKIIIYLLYSFLSLERLLIVRIRTIYIFTYYFYNLQIINNKK